MKKLVIYLLAFLLLGAGCLAAPMKLDGSAGKAILDGMNSRTENQTVANLTIDQTSSENESLDQVRGQNGGRRAFRLRLKQINWRAGAGSCWRSGLAHSADRSLDYN